MKHTKIVCTIGPASDAVTTLQHMLSAGMNVARLNFSHGTYPQHAALVRNIRAAAAARQQTVTLLQDLQGPRIRTGEAPEEGIVLQKGDTVVLLTQRDFDRYSGDAVAVPIQFMKLSQFVQKNGHITIQDGLIDIKITRVEKGKRIHGTVVQGGVVFSHKGLNAPGATLDIPVITKKDKADLEFGIKQGVDYVALSFVRDAKNIAQLRRLIAKHAKSEDRQPHIIAKIERAEAIDNFDEILEAVDGIMVARGDLGVELGPSKVPVLQKEMIRKCVRAGKPVIVATQMLESMTVNPRPTRAEAADVANAIIDHTDAIMLSAESATGKFPVKAVRTMTKIAREVERSRYDDLDQSLLAHRETLPQEGMAHAAVAAALEANAKAIVVHGANDELIHGLVQHRPQHIKIVVVSHNLRALRRLNLLWGVRSIEAKAIRSQKGFLASAKQLVRKQKLVRPGSRVVVLPYSQSTGQHTLTITRA